MKLSKKQMIILVCAAVVVLVAAIAGITALLNRPDPLDIVKNDAGSAAQSDEQIYVHVKGAVNAPGMVTLPKGARVSDAIEAAGGKSQDADLNGVNLAQAVSDGQEIFVPALGETGVLPAVTGEKSGLVNINTASKAELMTLSGVGEVLAQRIIDYRAEHKFNKIEDLQNVSGIGEKAFEKIRDEITV